jgi:thiol:disulfide interchange protein DsbA
MKVNKTTLKPLAICALSIAILTACGQKEVKSENIVKEEMKKEVVVKVEEVQAKSKEAAVTNLVMDNKTKNGIAVIEGVHYTKLKQPVDLEGLADNSVLEIFWLGCPHCQNFEEGVRTWKKTKTKNLQLKKIHAVSQNPRWIMDAHIFNTFEKLSNDNEKVMEGLFDLYIEQYAVYRKAIKEDPKSTEKAFPEIKLLSDYAQASGINAKEFTDTFSSEEIKEKVKTDGDVFIKAELQGVPAFIINKEYMITGKDAKSYEDYFQIVEKVAELTKK